MPLQITPAEPSAANTEPTTPPTSAWDDEDGIPQYQVITFQTIAPTRPAKMIGTVMVVSSTITFFFNATATTERNAPNRFMTAASVTATRRRSARVAIVVAIAFA